jgi:hypothetical protein
MSPSVDRAGWRAWQRLIPTASIPRRFGGSVPRQTNRILVGATLLVALVGRLLASIDK